MTKYDRMFKNFVMQEYAVKVEIYKNKIVIFCIYEGNEIHYDILSRKFTLLNKIRDKLISSNELLEIPIKNLEEVITYLKSIDRYGGLRIYIEDIILKLKVVEDSCIDLIRYEYNFKDKILEIKLKNDAKLWNRKWIISENKFYPLIIEEKDGYLKKEYKQNEIIEFLQKIASEKYNNLEVDIKKSDDKVFELVLKEIDEQTISVAPRWLLPEISLEDISEIDGVYNYFIWNHSVYSGMWKKGLEKVFRSNTFPIHIVGDDISEIINERLDMLNEWIVDDSCILKYKVFNGRLESKLYVYTDNTDIVGKTLALPYLYFNDKKVPLYDVSNRITKNKKILEICHERISISRLSKLGIGPLGMMVDGTSLRIPFELSCREILFSGGLEFEKICDGIDFSNINFNLGNGNYQLRAYNYINLLIRMGLVGGVIVPKSETCEFVVKTSKDLLNKYEYGKILIVGKKEELSGYKNYQIDIIDTNLQEKEMNADCNGVYATTHRFLLKSSLILKIKWDIIFFIKPEEMYKTMGSRAYDLAVSLKSNLRLCVLSNGLEKISYERRHVVNKLMKFKDGIEILNKLIGDANTNILNSSKYKFQENRRISGESFKNISKITIEEKGVNENMFGYRLNNGRRNKGNFKAEAMVYKNIVKEDVKEIPYDVVHPQYNYMSKYQRDWYYYWRNEVRNDNYIETSIGYIIMYIYETLNNIEYNPNEGYHKLIKLWSAYRSKHKMLDLRMGFWMFDFINFNCS